MGTVLKCLTFVVFSLSFQPALAEVDLADPCGAYWRNLDKIDKIASAGVAAKDEMIKIGDKENPDYRKQEQKFKEAVSDIKALHKDNEVNKDLCPDL